MSLRLLDDENYPAVTMGQAAELLGVQQAFLRSLDDTTGMRPARSGGGHRRYSRAQLARAGRIRELFDEGLNLDAVQRIIALQDELGQLRGEIDTLAGQLNEAHTRLAALDQPIGPDPPPAGGPHPPGGHADLAGRASC